MKEFDHPRVVPAPGTSSPGRPEDPRGSFRSKRRKPLFLLTGRVGKEAVPQSMPDILREALRRETATKVLAHNRLLEGEWVAADEFRPKVRRLRLRRLRETLEGIIFWGLVALVGTGLLALITVLL